jgi:hypothetical protein
MMIFPELPSEHPDIIKAKKAIQAIHVKIDGLVPILHASIKRQLIQLTDNTCQTPIINFHHNLSGTRIASIIAEQPE